jgi:hypothetical protein
MIDVKIEKGDWVRFTTENGIRTGCVEFIQPPSNHNNYKQLYITDGGNIEKKNIFEVRKADGTHVRV